MAPDVVSKGLTVILTITRKLTINYFSGNRLKTSSLVRVRNTDSQSQSEIGPINISVTSCILAVLTNTLVNFDSITASETFVTNAAAVSFLPCVGS